MTVIPVKPYFLLKYAEHDVTLTSFVAELQRVKLLQKSVLKFGGDTCIGLENIARKREEARNSPSGTRVHLHPRSTLALAGHF